MTDELNRLLDELMACAIEAARAMGDKYKRAEVAAARAAIHAYFERRKVEGGEDAMRRTLQWIVDVGTDLVSAEDMQDEARNALAKIDTARTEGKGNG